MATDTPAMSADPTVHWRMTDDHEARAMYVYLPGHPDRHGCVAKTREVGHGLMLDYDRAGNLIGIELLYV